MATSAAYPETPHGVRACTQAPPGTQARLGVKCDSKNWASPPSFPTYVTQPPSWAEACEPTVPVQPTRLLQDLPQQFSHHFTPPVLEKESSTSLQTHCKSFKTFKIHAPPSILHLIPLLTLILYSLYPRTPRMSCLLIYLPSSLALLF